MSNLNLILNTSSMPANKNAANKPRTVKVRNFNRIGYKNLNKIPTATNLDERVTYATAMRDYWFKFMLGVDGGETSKAFVLAMLLLSLPDIRKLPEFADEDRLKELISEIQISVLPSRPDPSRRLATDCAYAVTLKKEKLGSEALNQAGFSPHRNGIFRDILRRGVIMISESQVQNKVGIDNIISRMDAYIAAHKSKDTGYDDKDARVLKEKSAGQSPRSVLAAVFARDNKQKRISQIPYFPKYDLTPHDCKEGRGDVISYVPLPVFSKDAPEKHPGFQYVRTKDDDLTEGEKQQKGEYMKFVQNLKNESDKMVEEFFKNDYNKKRPALVLDDGGLSTEKGKRKEDQSSQNTCSGNNINETSQKNEYIHPLALKLVQEVVFVIGHSQFMYPALVDGFLPLVREMCKKLEQSASNIKSVENLERQCLQNRVLELEEENQNKAEQIEALTEKNEAYRQKNIELEKKLAKRDAQAEQMEVLLKNVNDNTKAISEIAKMTENLQNMFTSVLSSVGYGFSFPIDVENKGANPVSFPAPGFVPPSGIVNISSNGYGNSPLNVLGQFSTNASVNTFSPPIPSVS